MLPVGVANVPCADGSGTAYTHDLQWLTCHRSILSLQVPGQPNFDQLHVRAKLLLYSSCLVNPKWIKLLVRLDQARGREPSLAFLDLETHERRAKSSGGKTNGKTYLQT